MVGVFLVTNPLLSSAQKTKAAKPAADKATPPGAPQSANPPSVAATLQSTIVKQAVPKQGLEDYVPCQFALHELFALRELGEVKTLNAQDEEDLRSSMIAVALAPENASAFPKGKSQALAFAEAISQASFQGLTQSQALGKMFVLLNKYTQESEEAALLRRALDASAASFSKVLVEKYGSSSDESKMQSLTQKFTQAVGQGPSAEDKFAQAAKVAEENQDSLKPGVTTALAEAKNEASRQGADERKAQKEQVAEAVKGALGAITAPLDIGCSMAILSWDGTRRSFGETMANEFIVVQIVIRNLSADKEFLVHDAEFAVDADMNGRLGRYSSGVDKLTARGFMLTSRDYGRRNLTLHIAQGMGTLLSSISLVYGPGWKDAASVYNGGFITALTGVLPDHNTEHLNLLNDEGFSSYRTERTVVPKQGTAEFVIFIPSKQFEEGWWVQECAHQTVIWDSIASGANPDGKEEAHCVGQFNSASPDPKCKTHPNTGVDLTAARLVCLDYLNRKGADEEDALHHVGDAVKSNKNQGERTDGNAHETIKEEPGTQANDKIGADDKAGKPGLSYFKPKKLRYKKWPPQALALFRELSFAAVAGTHIQEEKDIKPTLTKVDCTVDEQGNLKFESAQNGSISCTLTGTNLDKVQKLRLRNADNITDNKTAEAAVTTSGDPKSGKALLQLDQLGPLGGQTYKVYTVTKDDIEDGGNLIIHLGQQPFLSVPPNPTEVDLQALKAKTSITLQGYHLDKLKEIHLTSGKCEELAPASDIKLVAETHEIGKATVSVGPDDVTGKVPIGDYTTKKLPLKICLTSTDFPNVAKDSNQSVFGTGNLTSAPAAGKGSAAKKAPAKEPAAKPKAKPKG